MMRQRRGGLCVERSNVPLDKAALYGAEKLVNENGHFSQRESTQVKPTWPSWILIVQLVFNRLLTQRQ